MSIMAVSLIATLVLLLLACTGPGLALVITDDDPCAYHVCKEGEVCKAVYNHLLQVPVATCRDVTANHSGGPCNSHTIGANIMSCKTQSDWSKVCITQCSLREAPLLSNVMVSYACFSYSGNDVTFLQATCTCCTQVPTTSAPSSQATQATTLLGKVNAENQGKNDDLQTESNHLYPLLLVGLVTIPAVAIVLACVAVLIRRQRRNKKLPSKMVTMVTSFENAGALVGQSPLVERKGNWNYSKLEDHKQESNSSPSPTPCRGYQKLIESYSSPDQ